MDYQSLYIKTVVELRRLAKDMGVKIPAGASKAVIINLLLEADQNSAAANTDEKKIGQPDKNATEAEAPAEDTEFITVESDRSESVRQAAEEDIPRMRVAANPQVVDRRMPARSFENPSAGESRAKPAYASQQPVRAAAGPVRTPQQNDARNMNTRYDRRQEGQQTRFADRNYSRQNSYVQRDGAGQPGRYNARQDAPDGRMRPQYDSRNIRPETVVEGRNRGYRPESDGRIRDDQTQDMRYARNAVYQRGADGQWIESEQDIPTTDNAYARYDGARNRYEGYYNEEYRTSNPAVPEMLAAGECTEGSGILEIQPDGYGFLRNENYQQGSKDVYVSIAQIRRFNLRMGDYVVGQTRPQREGDRYTAMMYITEVNGMAPEEMIGRPRFDELVPVYPDERLRLELPGENDLSLRMIDMLAPIGKGQRGLIVSQPKAGKTTLLKKLANAITAAHPEIHLIVLLIDERPEEVTDMKRSINGEVVYSTFDETPESHARVSEMVLERAQRLVELGKDVVVLMDSITRLARAYNLVIPPTGRSLSGGLDPGALHKPKRFFGAARNIENGGSFTVIATALIDTGSRMDDIIYEEFKGTGNMELHLDRKLSDKRIFPAVDMVRSGTRREELLLTEAELEGTYRVRRMLAGGNDQADMEKIISLIEKTGSNAEFYQRLTAYESVYEKSGFSMSRESGK